MSSSSPKKSKEKNMKLLLLETKNPYVNLAIEEYMFDTADDEIFMLWQNSPTVVIGKNQNAYAEIDMEVVKQKNIFISRRITGGGAVYHDLGNLNYSFISPNHNGYGLDFAHFTAPIIDALASMGVNASLSGRNDLIVGEKKFSGNAEYSKDNRVLHHGTLLFNSDLTVLSDVLRVDEEKLASKAIRSARSRVTNLLPLLSPDLNIKTAEQFRDRIAEYIIKKYSPVIISPPQNEKINELIKRNSSNDWLFPTKDLLSLYTLTKKKRFSFGGVEIRLEMKNDIIKDIRISGDFFSLDPTSKLEDIIRGTEISSISAILKNTDVGSYIVGMSAKDLCELILKE